MQHDNYGRGPLWDQLPAQTPADPDQIKLLCSILNYMMHLGGKKIWIFFQKGVYKVCKISGSCWGPLGHGWCLAAEAWCRLRLKTSEQWSVWVQGCSHWGFLLLPPSPPSRTVVDLCCVCKKSGLSFCLPAVHAQQAPGSEHCVWLLWVQWGEQFSASQEVSFFFPRSLLPFIQ